MFKNSPTGRHLSLFGGYIDRKGFK